MFDVYETADRAEVIIEGYAVEQIETGIRVSNLNNGHGVSVFTESGELIESNMGDIELTIAQKMVRKAMQYMKEGLNDEEAAQNWRIDSKRV